MPSNKTRTIKAFDSITCHIKFSHNILVFKSLYDNYYYPNKPGLLIISRTLYSLILFLSFFFSFLT